MNRLFLLFHVQHRNAAAHKQRAGEYKHCRLRSDRLEQQATDGGGDYLRQTDGAVEDLMNDAVMDIEDLVNPYVINGS